MSSDGIVYIKQVTQISRTTSLLSAGGSHADRPAGRVLVVRPLHTRRSAVGDR